MNETGRAFEQRNHLPRILGAIGAAGAILMLGAGAVTFLTQASPAALAATWWVGITTTLIGFIVMIYVVAARPSLSDRRDEREQRAAPGSALPMDDIDAELFRILADARLGERSTTPAAPVPRGALRLGRPTRGPKQ